MQLLKTVSFLLLINYLLYCVSLGFEMECHKFDGMLRTLAKIIGKCASPEVDYTGVVRHSESHNDWPIEFIGNVSVINLKDSGNAEEFAAVSHEKKGKGEQRLRTFIILTFSTSNFIHLIGKLRKTFLWDPLALYLILDDSTEVSGCQKAVEFLNITWIEDLLYSTYFCLDPRDGYMMYTYNPYSKRAPDTWEEIDPDKYTIRNHVWTVFKQRLVPDRTTCEDFSFDKTATIDGYPINGLALHSGFNMYINQSRTGMKQLGGPDGDIIRTALEGLRASLNLSVVWNSTDFYTYHQKVNNGEFDILMNTQYIYNKIGLIMTYASEVSGISLLTQFPGYEVQYTRIITYMNPKLVGLVFLVFAGTSVVLCICTGKGVIHSTLESYRLLLGTSTVRAPRRNPLRIYLTTVTFLLILTNSVFQGSLSSLLTIPIHKPYIDNADDLKEHTDYLVYVFRRFKDVIAQDWMEPRINVLNKDGCAEYVIENPKAACASEQTFMYLNATDHNLHLSRQRLISLYFGYVVRRNWPLYERLNSVLGILNEAGIIKYLREKSYTNILQKWASIEKEQASTSVFHVMALSDLMFAFYILLFGLSVATLVFLLEIFVEGRKCESPRNY